MRILSWNVNGLRAAVRKGFMDWLEDCDAEIIGLQEVRAREEQLAPETRTPENWHTHFVAAERKGYSGVGMYSKRAIDKMETSLQVESLDIEGRLQIATFGELIIANGYFPNGNGKNRDNSRVPYKLSFYQRLFDVLEEAKEAGKPILVMGDFNTAHQAIDLARPKQNEGTSGFLPEEREEFSRWVEAGWIDTFRHLNPEAIEAYSWWSQRQNARARNVGWRIDYILASPGAMPFVEEAFILTDVMGSDHCPIGVKVKDEIFSANPS